VLQRRAQHLLHIAVKTSPSAAASTVIDASMPRRLIAPINESSNHERKASAKATTKTTANQKRHEGKTNANTKTKTLTTPSV
jgi:hypothetical protein